MTEQITVKLNKKMFRPLLDEIRTFGGEGMYDSDSDLVAKSLFFTYYFMQVKQKSGKTIMETVMQARNLEKAEAVLSFLNDYFTFKKHGLSAFMKSGN
jgi:hypothetical protein